MSEQPVPPFDQTLSESQSPPSSPLPPVTLSRSTASDIAYIIPADEGDAAVSRPRQVGRFEVYGEIGRGGMGAVLRARDPGLGRDLALKVLLAGRYESADALRRFHEEAQIGGQLQHPGLVPVYELGADADGHPFFAMKLVDGQTLAALLKERQSPADNLPRFLTIFEQVCQALAYAHARGVIHRDLKPANIMVGAFGEVQVMDWGLAKVLSRVTRDHERPEQTAVHTARSESGGSESCAGSVLGTPAYMPPEQARGEIERLDARADVFGLGAILCDILTGQPPFTGRNVSELLGSSARGDLTESFLRLDGCGADAELVRLTKECLAAEPDARLRDGSEVAARMAAYRAGVEERLRTTELERAAAEGRAVEERRRRRTQLALASAVLLLLTLGGGGGWYVRQQGLKHEAEQARQETESVRREAEAERKQALTVQAAETDLGAAQEAMRRADWTEAARVLERAEARLAEGGFDGMRERLRQQRSFLALGVNLEHVRFHSTIIYGSYDHKPKREGFSRLFRDNGYDALNEKPEEVTVRIRGAPIRETLLAALDEWAFTLKRDERNRLLATANLADDHEARKRFRELWQRGDKAALLQLADKTDPGELTPEVLELLGNLLPHEARVRLLRCAQRRYPNDFWLNHQLGASLTAGATSSGPVSLRFEEAIGFYRAAVAARPQFELGHKGLGKALFFMKKYVEAEASFREALRLAPDQADGHVYLGWALYEQGRPREAEACHRKAIQLKPDASFAHYELAFALEAQGKLAEAADALRDAIQHSPDFFYAHQMLAFNLRRQGKFESSLNAYRYAHKVDPKMPSWTPPSEQWIKEAERLIELDRRLPDILDGKAKPANAGEQVDFARVCAFKGRRAAAVRFYSAAFQADPSLANDLAKEHRYAAARSAALAVAGKDEGSKPLDEPASVLLRKQVLGWLDDDLAAWGKRLDGGKPADRALVVRKMRHWQKDADLAGLRDADALGKLPEAERADWRNLWQKVDALQKQAAEPK